MKMLSVRRLTEAGMERMAEFIHSFASSDPMDIGRATEIMQDPELSQSLQSTVEVDSDRSFPRRFDIAKYLHERISSLPVDNPMSERGVWAWLALAWFTHLAPVEKGKRKVGELAKWIPESWSAWRQYRHLLLGPYVLYKANEDNPERAMVLLSNPPHTPGEIVGQLAAKQYLVQSRAFVAAATAFYYDSEKGTFRRGTAGRGAGSAARLRTVAGQFDRTFDLYSLAENQLIDLLPREFLIFRDRGKLKLAGEKKPDKSSR